jgi:hypothetical protein
MAADYGELTGTDASVRVTWGNTESRDYLLSLLNSTSPFSLAFGGAGASYGGQGGVGYTDNPAGLPYNDDRISDLLGGSGGCVRSPNPYELNALGAVVPTGRGGDGGGAIEIIAANDIHIGSFGQILARGGDGEGQSGGAGGGGSGGAILLAAGASIFNEGYIDAGGGVGGYSSGGRSGGGGGGGRVAMYAESIIQNGTVLVEGGRCGGYKIATVTPVLVVNTTVEMRMHIELGGPYLGHLSELFVNATVAPTRVVVMNVTSETYGTGYKAFAHLEISLPFNSTTDSALTVTSTLQSSLRAAAGYTIAEVVMKNSTVNGYKEGYFQTISTFVDFGDACTNDGQVGTFFTEAQLNNSMVSAKTNAAEGTKRALLLSNRGEVSGHFTLSLPPYLSYYFAMCYCSSFRHEIFRA